MIAALVQARSGNQEAVERLLRHVWPKLHFLATQALPGPTGVSRSDLIQVTAIHIANDIATFRGQTLPEFHAWVQTILRRRATELEKHEKAQKRGGPSGRVSLDDCSSGPGIGINVVAPHTSPTHAAVRNEQWQLVVQALDSLSVPQGQVIRLHKLEGRPLKEVAAALGITEEQANKAYLAGMKALQRRFRSEGSRQS